MKNFCKLTLLASVICSTLACANSGFIKVNGKHFQRDNKPYYFLGTNFWYGMNLGSKGKGGDRNRLTRELDRLQNLGVKNLRVLALSEGPNSEAWRILPAVQTSPGVFDETLLEGLDFLLSEMSKRDMTAVMCLNNFWPWSGGMAQYLNWFGQGSIPYPPPAENGDWDKYQKFTGKFYSNKQAVDASLNAIKKIITRVNTFTGKSYSEDTAIMSWQLANEPRGMNNVKAFNAWIENTSNFIRSLDQNHLITTGSEGETPYQSYAGMDFIKNHSYKNIDYSTIHIWAQNWNWYDPENFEGTYASAINKMKNYLNDHNAKAIKIGKPMVIEEFGLSREKNSYNPFSKTPQRDMYYREVFSSVLNLSQAKSPVAGVNFWAWAGEALPKQPYGSIWKDGDPFLGDPPHELQGWYSVYKDDLSTISVIGEFADKFNSIK